MPFWRDATRTGPTCRGTTDAARRHLPDAGQADAGQAVRYRRSGGPAWRPANVGHRYTLQSGQLSSQDNSGLLPSLRLQNVRLALRPRYVQRLLNQGPQSGASHCSFRAKARRSCLLRSGPGATPRVRNGRPVRDAPASPPPSAWRSPRRRSPEGRRRPPCA